MHWTDTAIVLSTKKHGENSAIVALLTQKHGLYKGLVKSITSKKNRGIYQIGNIIQTKWQARLEEHLGFFTSELEESISAFILHDKLRLLALSSACGILQDSLAEREVTENIYRHLYSFLLHLKNDSIWQNYYIFLELDLLNDLGFGLDLNSCAATGEIENLAFVSPKSGRAVSLDAGLPYEKKLLKLPTFVKNRNFSQINSQDINNGLELSGYFLNKYVFKSNFKELPKIREQFEQEIIKISF